MRMLTANLDLKLLVIGHTDMAGTFEYNRTLSQAARRSGGHGPGPRP